MGTTGTLVALIEAGYLCVCLCPHPPIRGVPIRSPPYRGSPQAIKNTSKSNIKMVYQPAFAPRIVSARECMVATSRPQIETQNHIVKRDVAAKMRAEGLVQFGRRVGLIPFGAFAIKGCRRNFEIRRRHPAYCCGIVPCASADCSVEVMCGVGPSRLPPLGAKLTIRGGSIAAGTSPT
jgi:hypothetical protein